MFVRFFIDRPIFASVLAIIILMVGLLSVFALPIAQYPGNLAALGARHRQLHWRGC